MSVTDELVEASEASAFAEGDLAMPPRRHGAVVACMDARLHVYRMLGPEVGEADLRQSMARIQANPFLPHKTCAASPSTSPRASSMK